MPPTNQDTGTKPTGGEPGHNPSPDPGKPNTDPGIPPAGTPPGGQPKPDETNGEKTYTKSEHEAGINRVVQLRLSEEKERERKRQEDARVKAEEEAAEKAGEWKKIADLRQAEIEKLQAENEKALREVLLSKIVSKHQLPDHWKSRLIGTTEAELDEDAARVAKDLAPPAAPRMGGGDAGAGTVTSKEAAEKAERDRMASSGRYSKI